MLQNLSVFFTALFCSITLFAQKIDVQHYQHEIELEDASDTIKGKTTIAIQFLDSAASFALHLVAPIPKKGGMLVQHVQEGYRVLTSVQTKDSLIIRLAQPARKGEVKNFSIGYSGKPQNGLIISKNKYGDRTFFGDNWPDRAHHWLPCHDTPADKASVEFIVIVPQQYRVISNGVQVAEKILTNGKKLSHWKEAMPIPTKVMVIGVARFAVKELGDSSLPVSAWVYPQDSTKGFYDYALAPRIVRFFTGYIGPYPFRKLANVQSTTMFGGMENAGAIFYDENTVTGTRKSEALIAHEIAHQWFGNTATEKSFAHLWLSEGFATYMTNVYMEQQYGRDTLLKRLKEERKQVILFSKKWNKPVVDSTSELMNLLNANSYQKGAWVLHMLRQYVGDSVFKKTIQTYYGVFKGRNADTKEFQKIAENISSKNLNSFFQQWLYQSALPQLDVKWKRMGADKISIMIQQKQQQLFSFPLVVGFVSDISKTIAPKSINVTEKETTIEMALPAKTTELLLDPFTELLFEGTITEVK